jgi:hypothetical protein
MQQVFPDLALRWSHRILAPRSPLSNFTASARLVSTRQLLSSPGEFDLLGGTTGATRIRSYPLSVTGTWAGARPFVTTFGANFVQRTDDRPGSNGRGSSMDFNGDIAKAFALPASWHPRGDLRTRISVQNSHTQSFVLNPLAIGCVGTYVCSSRLTDNGRRSATFTADTDVADNMTSSFVISRVESFDRNLSREFTQTVLSAILHLQFFAGEMH